jgi:hypothetical protein
MTNHVVRLYAFAGSLLVLFLTWATVAARPWASHAPAKADPRWAALVAREHRVRHETLVVQHVVARRWRVYRVRLAARKRAISAAVKRHEQQLASARAAAASASLASASSASAPSSSGYSAAAPSVRVVTLPPVTITRTS